MGLLNMALLSTRRVKENIYRQEGDGKELKGREERLLVVTILTSCWMIWRYSIILLRRTLFYLGPYRNISWRMMFTQCSLHVDAKRTLTIGR